MSVSLIREVHKSKLQPVRRLEVFTGAGLRRARTADRIPIRLSPKAIPRSRQDPKIGGKDDAEIISDRIAKLAPFPRDFVA
jgi:hypothetical protein